MNNLKFINNAGFVGEKFYIIPQETIKKYKDNPFVSRLYPTDIGYFPNAKGHYIERTMGIDEYIYFYCVSGSGTVCIEDNTYSLNSNTSICIPAHARHRYFSSLNNPWTILWVHFNGNDTKYYPLENKSIKYFQSIFEANRMLFLFDQLFDIINNEESIENFIYMSQTLAMILSETYYKHEKEQYEITDKFLQPIIKYFEQNIDKNISLQQLSEKFDISKSYINCLFKKNFNISPINYFITMKIKQACKLLRSTNKTIKSIAGTLGYMDQYYFSFLFKKIVGLSPTEYKKSNSIFF